MFLAHQHPEEGRLASTIATDDACTQGNIKVDWLPAGYDSALHGIPEADQAASAASTARDQREMQVSGDANAALPSEAAILQLLAPHDCPDTSSASMLPAETSQELHALCMAVSHLIQDLLLQLIHEEAVLGLCADRLGCPDDERVHEQVHRQCSTSPCLIPSTASPSAQLTHDAASRDIQVDLVHEQAVAVGLAHAVEVDYLISQARPLGDGDRIQG